METSSGVVRERVREAIAASRRALEIEPDNQKFVNDLGYTLIEAGQLEEAEMESLRAVAMDPKDGRAAANLEYSHSHRDARPRGREG